MREILFRGKQLDNGEWVEGAFCPKDCDMPFGPMVDKPSIIKLDDPCSGFWFEVDPDTVCQFTGLLDKNGKRIFEGDILLLDNIKGVVNYGTGCFCVKMTQPHYLCRNNPAIDIILNEYPGLEVIGNIHDNPELMGGGCADG